MPVLKDGRVWENSADTTCLDWIVPDNALFWLRDLTRGREEHIFFMQNGRQKFPTF